MIRGLGLCVVSVLAGWLVCSNTAQADRDRRHEEGTRLTIAVDFDYAGRFVDPADPGAGLKVYTWVAGV